MHSKVINPGQHGRFVFSNKGSCSKTVSYLGHEAREHQQASQFFNHERVYVAAEEVRTTIDRNAKGLRKSQEKFYSLVLSPSQAELKHLENDPEKLQQYTRQVMENYASGFQFKQGSPYHGKRLSSSELVWFATFHQERKVKEGERKGVSKVGSHQHVHIIVSGKDRSGEMRLNPRSHKSHFSMREWQLQNGKTFQQMFGYEKATVSEKLTQGMPQEQVERHQDRIRNKVEYLNQYFVGSQKLEVDKALSIAEEKQYGKGFFFNLHRLTQHYQQGKLVHDPYQVLEKGKEDKISFPERNFSSISKSIHQLGQEAGEDEELFAERKKKRRSIDIEEER